MSASVFPARAGMSRTRERIKPANFGVPRASGDEPGKRMGEFVGEECSPRERG